MSRRWMMLLGVSVLALGGGVGAYSAVSAPHGTTPAEIAALPLPQYGPQKALYHLTTGGGMFDRNFKNILHIARNHLNAVGKDRLELRFVVQGDGIELLTRAKANPDLSRRIDELKRDGVRFLICRNTVTQRGIDPAQEIYDFSRADLVRAGAGEATALTQQGFAYLKM